VQQPPEPLGARQVEGGPDGAGPPRARLQGGQPPRIESVDRLTHGLVVAAEVAGNGRRPFTAGARKQDLATAQDKGIT
jgi:hypothetical protein